MIELEKFTKGKNFSELDFALDDPSDKILVKTNGGSAVGDAIADAIAAIPDAASGTQGLVALAAEDDHPSTDDTTATTPAYVAAAIDAGASVEIKGNDNATILFRAFPA